MCALSATGGKEKIPLFVEDFPKRKIPNSYYSIPVNKSDIGVGHTGRSASLMTSIRHSPARSWNWTAASNEMLEQPARTSSAQKEATSEYVMGKKKLASPGRHAETKLGERGKKKKLPVGDLIRVPN